MKNRHRILFSLLTVLIIGLLVLSSCTRTAAVARGWAGPAASDGILYFATMTGKLYAIERETGAIVGEPIQLEIPASGGLGCVPTCGQPQSSPVALYASPTVQGQLVFVGGFDGKVYAFPFIDGKLREEPRWIYPRQGSIGTSIIGGLVVAGDKLYFGSTGGTVYALNAAEGYKEWTFNTGSKIWSTPAYDGDTIYITCFNKKVYALDAASGQPKWEYETGGAITATAIVADGRVYLGSFDRHFYALEADTGRLAWKFPAADGEKDAPRNWFWAEPVVYGGTIYAPNLDGRVYALDSRSGTLKETFDFKHPVSSSPVLVDGGIVIAATDIYKKTSKVYLITTADNRSRELSALEEGINAPLFYSQGTVYLHTTRDSFYSLNPQTGATQKFSLKTSK